jgi:hypothetical protein
MAHQVNPTARIEAGASQDWAFMASENQKPNIVNGVHVRRSIGVTSMSTLVLASQFQYSRKQAQTHTMFPLQQN